MMRHQGALFGNGPFSLLPHIHPSLIGSALAPPPMAGHPLHHGFKSHRLPYFHPCLIPHPATLTPILPPLPPHRNLIIKHKMFRSLPYVPYSIPRNGHWQAKTTATFKSLKQHFAVPSKSNKSNQQDDPTTKDNTINTTTEKPDSGESPTASHNGANNISESDKPSICDDLPPTIPPEMTKPLFCELCEAKLNSPLQATSHYEGKNHAKKVRFYLERMREKMGKKSATIATAMGQTAGKQDLKKDTLEEEYCKLCDVAFTSVVQATQHHNGRNHQRRLRGENPLPKGFFNPSTRKWQRQPPSFFLSQFKHRVISKGQNGVQRIKVGF